MCFVAEVVADFVFWVDLDGLEMKDLFVVDVVVWYL